MFALRNKKENTVTKEYKYSNSKGTIVLKFGLRVDIKHELKDFKELLKEALKDVEEDLEKL